MNIVPPQNQEVREQSGVSDTQAYEDLIRDISDETLNEIDADAQRRGQGPEQQRRDPEQTHRPQLQEIDNLTASPSPTGPLTLGPRRTTRSAPSGPNEPALASTTACGAH